MIADGEVGGTSYGWSNWFERTWDYGGGSLLGTGIHLDFLNKYGLLVQKTDIITSLLDLYKSSLLGDISHGIYMQAIEDVVKELSEILQLEFLTEKEKEPLQKLLSDWENSVEECENCVDNKYQFGCRSIDCNWGG